MKFVGNWRVFTKIVTYAALTILVVAVLGGYVIRSFGQIGEAGQAVSATVQLLNHVLIGEARFKDIVAANREVRAGQEPAAIQPFVLRQRELSAAVRQELDVARRYAALPENRERIRRPMTLQDTYAQAANRTAEARTAFITARSQLFAQGPVVERDLNALLGASAFTGLAQEDSIRGAIQTAVSGSYAARIAAPASFATGETASGERAANEMRRVDEVIRGAIGRMPPGHAATAALREAEVAIGGYSRILAGNFTPLADQARIEQQECRPSRIEMERVFNDLRMVATRRSDALETQATALQSSVLIAVIAVGGAAILILMLGAWILSRALATPLRGLTGQMGEIAGGRFDLTVAAQDRGNEIGDMARALEGFRKNGMRMKSLEKDAESSRLAAEQSRRSARPDAPRRRGAASPFVRPARIGWLP